MIDMDDLLGDSDFFQPMDVWRRAITFDNNGNPVDSGSWVAPRPLASLQSGANPELARLVDMTSTSNLITIYTSFSLYSEGDTLGAGEDPQGTVATDSYGNPILPPGFQQFRSDTVMYHGDPYQVFLVQDWTDYGSGFVAALARKITMGQASIS